MKVPYFSYELYLKDVLTGNEIIDNIIKSIDFYKELDKKECALHNSKFRNKFMEISSPLDGKYLINSINKNSGICYKFIVKKQWIIWR